MWRLGAGRSKDWMPFTKTWVKKAAKDMQLQAAIFIPPARKPHPTERERERYIEQRSISH